jgi:hypothetical protein
MPEVGFRLEAVKRFASSLSFKKRVKVGSVRYTERSLDVIPLVYLSFRVPMSGVPHS